MKAVLMKKKKKKKRGRSSDFFSWRGYARGGAGEHGPLPILRSIATYKPARKPVSLHLTSGSNGRLRLKSKSTVHRGTTESTLGWRGQLLYFVPGPVPVAFAIASQGIPNTSCQRPSRLRQQQSGDVAF